MKNGKGPKTTASKRRRTPVTVARIGLFGLIFGDKDHIAQNVATLAVVVLLLLLVARCCGAPSVAAAVTASALIGGVTYILHDMLHARPR